MKNCRLIDWACGIFDGVSMYLICVLLHFSPYIDITFNINSLPLLWLLGIAINLGFVLYKNKVPNKPSVRLVIMLFVLIAITVCCTGSMGLILRIEGVVGYAPGSFADNASGLVSLAFVGSLIVSTAIALFALAIIQNIRKTAE